MFRGARSSPPPSPTLIPFLVKCYRSTDLVGLRQIRYSELNLPFQLRALQFSYYPQERPARAVTKNKIYFDPTNTKTLTTVLSVDGLERVIQTKKEGEISASGGEATTYGMNVTGTVTFDAQGRIDEEGQPVFESGYDKNYWAGATMVRPTANQYDVLDRKTLVTLPDQSTMYFVKRFYPEKSSGNTHQVVGSFCDTFWRISACFIR